MSVDSIKELFSIVAVQGFHKLFLSVLKSLHQTWCTKALEIFRVHRVEITNSVTVHCGDVCQYWQCRINQSRGPVPQPIAGPFSDSRRTFQRNHLAKTFSLSITKNTMKHDHKHSISYAFIVVDMAGTREGAQEILKMWSTKARGPQKRGALWPCHSCHIG